MDNAPNYLANGCIIQKRHYYYRHFTYQIYHDVGTCKMGIDSKEGAVVDPKLKVHGLRGLRVADASIMPNLISGNTQVACYTIGEKASDLILEERFYSKFDKMTGQMM